MSTNFEEKKEDQRNKTKEEEKLPQRIYVLNNVISTVQEKLKRIHFEDINESSALSILQNETQGLFILQDFKGPLFDAISRRNDHWIYGQTAVLELLHKNLPIVPRKRNVFSLSMDGLIFYLSIRDRDDRVGKKLAMLIRHMGGSVRKDFRNITHMISNSVLSGRYTYATTFLIPIMTPSWVDAAWEMRNIVGFKANNEEMLLQYKLKPFAGLYVSFIGFLSDNNVHLQKLKENEGVHINVEDFRCTHVVIGDVDKNSECKFVYLKNKCFITLVQSKWFWDSIEKGEKLLENLYEYKFDDENIVAVINQELKYTEENLAVETSGGQGNPKQDNNDEEMKAPVTVLPYSVANEINEIKDSAFEYIPEPSFVTESKSKYFSINADICDEEHPCAIEFIDTEKRYIQILDIILQIYYISTKREQNNDGLISKTEAKIIFGNIGGIVNTHKKILNDIISATNKTKDLPKILLKHTDDLIRFYPVFSDNFEESQKMLQSCCNEKPKFREFLEEWKHKQESGRQHLRELLIRPIQRLGSISLLLKEIYRTIPENSPNREDIQHALHGLENVMGSMSKSMERTDQMSSLFETYNCIVNCPADLISSQRTFQMKFIAVELTGQLASHGEHLIFFLFCDIIEVCRIRKRIKAFVLAGENEEKYLKIVDGKPYKHQATIPISEIRRVIDIADDDDFNNSFALVRRKDSEIKEKIYCFRYISNMPVKNEMLRKIATCIAMQNSFSNVDLYISSLLPREVGNHLKSSDTLKGSIINVVRSLF